MVRVPALLLAIVAGLVMPVAAAEPKAKPVIGINMFVAIPDADATATRLSVTSTYVDAVTQAGGIPLVLPPVASADAVARYVELVDGFVFTGGSDINPARFGQEPHPTWNPNNPRREEFDFLLMEKALESGKPVLAICLGMQVMNVLKGGSIIQDIPDLVKSDVDHKPQGGQHSAHAHDVEVLPGSRLHALLGNERLGVNSIHHQACEVVEGTGVVASAVAPDGVVEGIELVDHPFAVGVQWHPEYMTSEEPHLNLFRGLVEAASQRTIQSEEPTLSP